jgi:hypothetical protein
VRTSSIELDKHLAPISCTYLAVLPGNQKIKKEEEGRRKKIVKKGKGK